MTDFKCRKCGAERDIKDDDGKYWKCFCRVCGETSYEELGK